DLDAMFRTVRKGRRKALIPYLTAGHPSPEEVVPLAVAVLEAGADALEFGIPFSDPLLDGPATRASQQQALEAGITPRDCLRFAGEIHETRPEPLVLMGAYNPVLSYGLEAFARDAAAVGVSGLDVTDVPLEEQAELAAVAARSNLHLIQLLAPTSTDGRIARASKVASGFIYCISVAGVTGTRVSIVDTARPLVERVRRATDVPVAVGFGISGPKQAREVATFADGVIVGSALINLIEETPRAEREEAVREFVGSLRRALDTVSGESPG
ncbi:MAG: tryptophan synthase subunit alpha, partial [Chloroflexota bacterium]